MDGCVFNTVCVSFSYYLLTMSVAKNNLTRRTFHISILSSGNEPVKMFENGFNEKTQKRLKMIGQSCCLSNSIRTNQIPSL